MLLAVEFPSFAAVKGETVGLETVSVACFDAIVNLRLFETVFLHQTNFIRSQLTE